MNTPTLNEDVENMIKSFIPEVDRWVSLRKVYNDTYLREGLVKKTVTQLTLIQKNLIEMVNTGELSGLRFSFYCYNMDIEELKSRKRICWTTLDKWKNIGGKKDEKIEKIIKFIHQLGNVIRLKRIYGFSSRSVITNYGISKTLYLSKKRLNPAKQNFYACKALKLLNLLVSILKNPKKKKEKNTIVTEFTEVD